MKPTTYTIEYIQSKLYDLATSKYSDPKLANQYIIGFLTQQLAQAGMDDSKVLARFRDTIDASRL